MRIVLTHQTVVNHDAIGNDIEVMCKFLSQKHDCMVYAQNCLNKSLKYIDEESFYKLLNDQNAVIIYHHSVFWEEGEAFLHKTRGKIVIRYHNITPPEFFAPYDSHSYSQCKLGREQTMRFAEEFPDAFWLVDSEFNSLDVSNVNKERLVVFPPLNKTEEWAKGLPDENLLSDLINSSDINLLFIGRVAPNKGHMFLLDVMNAYCTNYDTGIKLRIIGRFYDELSDYNDTIKQRIVDYHIEDNVEFIGEINDALLSSYYLGSDFFICASEHEGFCVPIVESQFFGLPVIARYKGAVPETVGMNQITLREDPYDYAAAIRLIYENSDYYCFLRNNGMDNYQSRFSMDILYSHFANIFENNLGVPV